ncbi:glycine cleavage system protein H [Rhodoblastus sphagnicola]|uniref:Glycine cleavage system H protein n=1 Tax=Rhodoblastus sphagnicola TaxID=333368 RepID=A0A2S6NBN1_9HYPH|nr:glycine cleavage system protein GcvH [Rhodoblastus sphagnicola]MBB4199693.1 glycine cleavage system H protein [Rhodoblastus sphagnicola]PPQ32030.1 glycine cleavage system protein H [Rhodoblastus sphagnicola]
MTKILFTKDHEYIVVEGDIGAVGITDFAQGQLGDVVFVELPEIGKVTKPGDQAGVVESVKAASDVFAPIAGEVVEVNKALEENPALVNEDAQGAGWFYKVKIGNPAELDALLDEAAYKAHLESLA